MIQRAPFSHGNISLAVALHCSGQPICHAERCYTQEDEAKFGLRARELTKKDTGGNKRVSHAATEEIEQLIAAYDDQSEKEDLVLDPPVSPEQIVRIMAHGLKTRTELVDLFRNPKVATLVKSKGAGRVDKRDGGATLTHPGFVKCSDEDRLRAELGIPYRK